MAMFNVHVGIRYTTDYMVEADNESEARDIAESLMIDDTPECMGTTGDWHFANDDYDVWGV